jgi:putative transposase
MCKQLKVSTSGYYDWRNREACKAKRDNIVLLGKIREIHDESDGVIGSPRMTDRLNSIGYSCSSNRVARLMKVNNIKGIPQNKKWLSKKSTARPDGIINHLNRDFNAQNVNTKWVTDITYIKTAEGWLYLCVVIDLYSKVVIGWSMSQNQTTHLVIQAVLMALWQKERSKTVILHSDRGSQFTSDDYQKFLFDNNVISSMSAVGSCADNAACEGFFGVMKRERVNRRNYKTRSQARADIFDYIERFHNPVKKRKLEKKLNYEKHFSKMSVKSG